MKSSGLQGGLIVRVEDDSYCPYYINRKKEKQPIDDFLKRLEEL